jgi:hypothetical protein
MVRPTLRPMRLIAAGSTLVMALALFASPGVTLARNGGGVAHAGTCTAASTTKIKLNKDNGRIEVQFEVDQNRVGKTWNVRLRDNGVTFFTGQRVTLAPGGSFELRRLHANMAGPDRIVGRATNPKTGEVCTATATI